MVASNWKTLLPLIFVSSLLLYEEWISIPSCKIIVHEGEATGSVEIEENQEDLKVMIVADLLLRGSDAGFLDLYFRDYYMSKFFRKSYQSLRPDMLLVLGDISDEGMELSGVKWMSVLQKFHDVLGPFLQLPYHVVLGDRDIGNCSSLDAESVYRLTRNFPGLDPAGCGVFEISNISFVSLNSVSLLCGNNELQFSIEKVIETERMQLQMITERNSELMGSSQISEDMSGSIKWRQNPVSPGSGPVLLLHFPMHQTGKKNCNQAGNRDQVLSHLQQETDALKNRYLIAPPYELEHSLPLNATEYILQALKPRIIFSAHKHEFCYNTHLDGTQEVIVPTMAWKAKDDPGFIVSIIHSDRKALSVSYCALARESHILIVYSLILIMSVTTLLVNSTFQLKFSNP